MHGTSLLKPTSELAVHTALHGKLIDITTIVHTLTICSSMCYRETQSTVHLQRKFGNVREGSARHRIRLTRIEGSGLSSARHLHATARSRAVLPTNHDVVAVGTTLTAAYLAAAQAEWTSIRGDSAKLLP